MTKPHVAKKFDIKGKKANKVFLDEEGLSFREIKNDKNKKHYRNYENALRSKDIGRLLSYEEDYD